MPTASSRATSKANAKANDTLTARHSAQMKITASLEKKQDSTDQSIQISTNTSTKKNNIRYSVSQQLVARVVY